MEIILVLLFSYFSGSIPFGLIITKIFIGKDVRKIGSGNIGSTNVLRAGNKYLAGLTLVLDALKGFFPVVVCQSYFPEYTHFSALLAFLGHIFPIWLKFKGGKGVATFIGVLFALSYELGFLFIFTWMAVFLIFKYSSLSSLFSSLTVFVVTFFKENAIKIINPDYIYVDNLKFLLFIFLVLIIFTHKKNISNLKNRSEPKIKL